MAEEIKDGDDGKLKPEEHLPPKDLVLTITLKQDTGQLTVQGPGTGEIFDEPICFWMLYKAQRFIEAINMRANQSRIVTPGNRARIKDIFRRH